MIVVGESCYYTYSWKWLCGGRSITRETLSIGTNNNIINIIVSYIYNDCRLQVSHLIEAYAQLLVRPYSQTFPRQLWWHGDISGEEASELLKEKKPGTFIIRFSGTQVRFSLTTPCGGCLATQLCSLHPCCVV